MRPAMTFDRVVCGVDGSPAGIEALRQALCLRAPAGRLVAVTVAEWMVAVRTGFEATKWAADLREHASRASEEAMRAIGDDPSAEARVVEGRPIPALLETARKERASLIAVGTHGMGRPAGALLGSVATAMLHDAPCPVLVARSAREGAWRPRTIVAGVDGSAESLEAAATARAIAERFGGDLRLLAALGGKPLEAGRLQELGDLDRVGAHPVDGLVDASRAIDLLVVGSRGLHGIRALGSVSERIAHRAACSVLVIRPLALEAG